MSFQLHAMTCALGNSNTVRTFYISFSLSACLLGSDPETARQNKIIMTPFPIN